MSKRRIIHIDQELCDGCGLCVTACAEGAIQVLGGKARLVSDVYCDGLGDCLGECPQGAISVVEREARPFDEQAVERHLAASRAAPVPGGCPGTRGFQFDAPDPLPDHSPDRTASALRQWPVKLHLISPRADHFKGAHLLLAADCTAFAMGALHGRFLAGRALAIACPKLDAGQEVYHDKLVALIDEAQVASITVLLMEVPCCRGLLRLATEAAAVARRVVPVSHEIVSVRGAVVAGPSPRCV